MISNTPLLSTKDTLIRYYNGLKAGNFTTRAELTIQRNELLQNKPQPIDPTYQETNAAYLPLLVLIQTNLQKAEQESKMIEQFSLEPPLSLGGGVPGNPQRSKGLNETAKELLAYFDSVDESKLPLDEIETNHSYRRKLVDLCAAVKKSELNFLHALENQEKERPSGVRDRLPTSGMAQKGAADAQQKDLLALEDLKVTSTQANTRELLTAKAPTLPADAPKPSLPHR